MITLCDRIALTGQKSSMQIEEIFDRFGGKLYNYLTIKLGSALDAEDVLQEVFCRLAGINLRFRFLRNPQAYVFKTARNEALRFLGTCI